MIDLRHELVTLAGLIDWEFFEREWAGFFPSTTGRPATSPRLVAGLLYLQHAFRLSDEAVIARWVENPYFQHFTGETFFQHKPPIDPTSLIRWRKRIGEEGVEWLLTKTIEAGRKSGAVEDGIRQRSCPSRSFSGCLFGRPGHGSARGSARPVRSAASCGSCLTSAPDARRGPAGRRGGARRAARGPRRGGAARA